MDSLGDARLTRLTRFQLQDLVLVYRLALADYAYDRRLSLPLIISLSAVLTPLLVLFGLKFGIVSTMSRELSEDPRTRELRPLGQGAYDSAWFELLRGRPDVTFVLPSTRFLAATMSLRQPGAPLVEPVNAELRPSAGGDPLLEYTDSQPDGFRGIILSTPAAEALGVGTGDRIQGRIGRTLPTGQREVIRLELRVDAVLPAAQSGRVEALVSLPFLLAAEDFREGFAVPAFSAGGRKRPPDERRFASFRLYAVSIFDVESLRQWLADKGVQSDTRIAEIQLVQRLDRSLTILFLIIAGLGGSGYVISLTVSLWANTERKRRELSILRLAGLRAGTLALMPGLQAMFTALLGSMLAVALYLIVEILINHLFRESLTSQQVLSRLELHHFIIAVGITILFAVLASLVAGFRAAGVSPSEGLRDD